MSRLLRLHRTEVLGFAVGLHHEIGGVRLGIHSPTRILNQRTGLNWTSQQWFDLLESHYERLVSPTPPPRSVHSP